MNIPYYHNTFIIIKGYGATLRPFIYCSIFLLLFGCRKLVEIPPPTSRISTTQVFSTDAQATSAMAGVYYSLVNVPYPTLASGGMTIYCGLSADELLLYYPNPDVSQFYDNKITPNSSIISLGFWNSTFSVIYQANAVLDGIENSKSISDSVRKELIGEAKFVRAMMNFYLTNLFGNIPYVTDINWRKTSLSSRMSSQDVYKNIVSDLIEVETLLPSNYSVGKGQRIVPNKFAASALLAKVYLYSKEWQKASVKAAEVINSGIYNLTTNLNDVFTPNSSEAIWQLQQDNSAYTLNGTQEGITLIPFESPYFVVPPFAYLSASLLNSFEANDNRKSAWLNYRTINGTNFYYPYKYKTGPTQAQSNAPYLEYYMVMRLAEQILIRAEALANQSNLVGAISDLNLIRNRAGLSPLSASLTQQQILDAVSQERRIEFFSEWGNRWLDLKRWGNALQILSANKGQSINNNSLLFPIPVSEISTNPNLSQNPGY